MVIRLIFDPVNRMELSPDVNNPVFQTVHSHKPEKGVRIDYKCSKIPTRLRSGEVITRLSCKSRIWAAFT